MKICPKCGAKNRNKAKFCNECGHSLASKTGTELLPTPPENAALGVGETLHTGRYVIRQVLGCGGMGAVYQAEDMRLPGRLVAIKENADTSQNAQAQFRQEANILARLNHPNLPSVTDHFIEPSGRQYLVMDYIAGQDLDQIIAEQGALPEAQVLPWIAQVMDALEYLHGQDPPIIHRDVKPDNIKLTSDGRAVLVDFGLAKAYQVGRKTSIGARGVSPGFSPPEQYGQGSTDIRSDIYALGATMYALLTGIPSPESVERLAGMEFTPPRAINAHISSNTDKVIMKAMNVDPARRYQSIAEMRRALLPPNKGDRSRLPGWLIAVGGLGTVGLIMLCGLLTIAGVVLITHRPGIPTPVAETTLTPAPTSTLAATRTPTPTRAYTPSPTPPPTSTPIPGPRVGEVKVIGNDGAEMVYIPEGEFIMGSEDPDANANEKPRHEVYLDAFWIDRYEVTNAQFQTFVNATGYKTTAERKGKGGRWSITSNGWTEYSGLDWRHPHDASTGIQGMANHPVVQVNWDDAVAYCQWAGKRLPTEAEWEKAARGTDGRRYPWGDELPAGTRWNFCGTECKSESSLSSDGYSRTAPVGSFEKGKSFYGAYDMAGNVWEWVADWYSENYYSVSPYKNPQGPDKGSKRVIRGGSWANGPQDARVTNRPSSEPIYRLDVLGFRCAISADEVSYP